MIYQPVGFTLDCSDDAGVMIVDTYERMGMMMRKTNEGAGKEASLNVKSRGGTRGSHYDAL